MNHFYSTIFVLLFLLLQIPCLAQQYDDLFSKVKHELFVGGGIHTGGFQIKLAYGNVVNEKRTINIPVEFVELLSLKEYQQTYDGLSITGGAPKSFIYGKQNNFYCLNVAYTEKYYLSAKSESQLSMAIKYGAGLALGMLRPYYLDLIYRDNFGRATIIAERYNEDNQFKFLNPQEVDGPSGASYGWEELSFKPGLLLQLGVVLDWGATHNILKDAEIGVATNIFFEEIPIMIFEENTPIFINLFLNIHLGHRW